jgi:hypothetical protein
MGSSCPLCLMSRTLVPVQTFTNVVDMEQLAQLGKTQMS